MRKRLDICCDAYKNGENIVNRKLPYVVAALLAVLVLHGQAQSPSKPLSVKEQLEQLAAEEAAKEAVKPQTPAPAAVPLVRRVPAPAPVREQKQPERTAPAVVIPAASTVAAVTTREEVRPANVALQDADAVHPAVWIGAGTLLLLGIGVVLRRRLRKWFDDLTVRTKIAVVSVASVVPLVLFILGYLIPAYAQDKFNERSAATRQVVDIAYNLMKEYDDRIRSGEFTEAEAKKRYVDRINRMRYNENDYMWLNDLQPRMIFHPMKKEMNGADLSDYTDPHGRKLFVDMANICREQGEGSVLYEWPKPGQDKPALKISYVRLYRPWGWIVGSGVYADDIQTQVAGMRWNIMAGAFLVSLIAVGFGLVVGGWYKKDLSEVVQKMDHAELRMRFRSERKDEIGALQRSFDAFVSNIHDTLSEVMHASERVAGATVEISSSAEQLAAGSEEQSSQANEVTSAVTDMTATISSNAKNAAAAAAIARQAKEAAYEGGRVVERTVNGMRTIADVVEQSAETVQTPGKSSDEIGEIVLVINEIADQTNLLALNAAIEAARAGDQGRGFAVVADEVRKLAERTSKATQEIGSMIGRIQTETKRAVGVMHEGTRKVHDGIEQADKAGAALKEIVDVSQRVTDMVSQIAEADERQSTVSEMITKNVDGISAVAHESANSTQQIARAAEDLNRMTEQLQQTLSQFKLGTGENAAGTAAPASPPHAPVRSRKAVAENGMIVEHR